jgi:hypothetical protein
VAKRQNPKIMFVHVVHFLIASIPAWRRLRMKRRFSNILTLMTALVLFSGLAFASESKKQAQPVDLTPETIAEEKALIAELMDASGEHQNKRPGINDNLKKSNGGRSGVRKDHLKIKIIPEATHKKITGFIIAMQS